MLPLAGKLTGGVGLYTSYHYSVCPILIALLFLSLDTVLASRHADQLYEDLMYFYNKNVRPVKNTSEPLRVKFGASLIRIIDVVGHFLHSKLGTTQHSGIPALYRISTLTQYPPDFITGLEL